MFLLFGSWVLNPSRVHNTRWAIITLWMDHHPIPSLSLWFCHSYKIILKMGFRPPEGPDVSLRPLVVASRLTAEDLGTFWSRRKKSRANQASRPFSSFWSRRKKSRAKLPTLPFSTIIRLSLLSCPGSVVSSPRPHQGKRPIYWSKRSSWTIWTPITQPSDILATILKHSSSPQQPDLWNHEPRRWKKMLATFNKYKRTERKL